MSRYSEKVRGYLPPVRTPSLHPVHGCLGCGHKIHPDGECLQLLKFRAVPTQCRCPYAMGVRPKEDA